MGVRDVVGRAARAPKGVVVGYWRGLTYPFRGLRFVFVEHPGLVRFWIFPIVLTLGFLGLVFRGVWEWHDDLFALMLTEPSGEGFWSGVGRFFHGVVETLFALVLFVLGLVLAMLLASVFAAPFNDALSEEVERLVAGHEGPPFQLRTLLRDLVRTIGLELLKICLYLLVMGPLFILSLVVPGVGQVVYTIFGFLFTSMYWAIDYIDWPASRQNRGIHYRFGMASRHFLPMFGFGTGVWLFLFVPLVNLLFMPAAVAGGTLLYLDLESGGSAAGDARSVMKSPKDPPPE